MYPFETWDGARRQIAPNWWIAYNRVKHQRSEHFAGANLRNTIAAMSACSFMVAFLDKDWWDWSQAKLQLFRIDGQARLVYYAPSSPVSAP
jgi:hypothetical protein